ncbi:MAG: hypothetical protein VW104_02180 [Halieaceae bacterium]|jgi:histone H3/H4
MARTKAEAKKKIVGADPKGEKVRKKRRMKRIKGHIRKLQRTTNLLISKASFNRAVRQILGKHGPFKIEPRALRGLHEAAEPMIIQLMQDADRIARINGGRAGPLVADLHTAVAIGHPELLTNVMSA